MNNIYVTGDIHGNSISFRQRIQNYIPDADETDSLICLGDVGLEYGNKTQGNLRKQMSHFPGTIYVMRGNHDTRYWRDHENSIDSWVIENDLLYRKKYDNIKYIKDSGGLYNINGNNILFIPGAYSIDKYYRLDNGFPYEFEEQLKWHEQNNIFNIVTQNQKIDYVCSHTAPLCVYPYFKDLFLNFVDQSQVDNNMEKFLNEIYILIGKSVKRWYFGHFHDDRDVSTNFTMLYTEIVKLGEKLER